MNATDELLRDKFASLTEPEPLDADLVVSGARGRKTRRDVLRLGGGTAAIGALAGLTWMGLGQVSGRQLAPGNPGAPSTGRSASAPQTSSTESPASESPASTGTDAPAASASMSPAEPWPVKGDPQTGTVYRVDGNLGFRFFPDSWEFWDLSQQAVITTGDWSTQSAAAAVVANCVTGHTHSDKENYFGTLVPGPVGMVTMRLVGSQREVIVSGAGLPLKPPFVLLHWHEQLGRIESGGPFEMKLEPGPNQDPLTIRINI